MTRVFKDWHRSIAQPAGAPAPPIPVIALTASEHDRKVLDIVCRHQPVQMHFAESRTEAWEVMNRIKSPVLVFDRDWPNVEWRTMVRDFASAPQWPCIILASRVADEYLWQELIRCGGHDLLTKPLRLEDVSRTLKLALIYWKNARGARK